MRAIERFTYDPSLVLWLPLRDMPDGASLQSRDAYGHACTVTGATWGLQGRTFDGVDDDILVPASTPFANPGDITVMCWHKPDVGFDADHRQLVITEDVAWYLGTVNATGVAQFTVGGQTPTTPAALVANNWYHLVGNRDASAVRLYADGQLADSHATAAIANAARFIRIGRHPTIEIQPVDGIIDDVRVYNRALSAPEIAQIYEATKARYA